MHWYNSWILFAFNLQAASKKTVPGGTHSAQSESSKKVSISSQSAIASKVRCCGSSKMENQFSHWNLQLGGWASLVESVVI